MLPLIMSFIILVPCILFAFNITSISYLNSYPDHMFIAPILFLSKIKNLSGSNKFFKK